MSGSYFFKGKCHYIYATFSSCFLLPKTKRRFLKRSRLRWKGLPGIGSLQGLFFYDVTDAVEGGNGELGFYLVTDGSRTPYRLHFRRPCFIYYQAYPEMIKGAMLSDAIVILSSLNVIAGELDA